MDLQQTGICMLKISSKRKSPKEYTFVESFSEYNIRITQQTMKGVNSHLTKVNKSPSHIGFVQHVLYAALILLFTNMFTLPKCQR